MKSLKENIPVSDVEPLFTLQIASKLSKTSVYSIRQYIDHGLIIPYRKKTNRHLFSQVDIARLQWIRKNLDEHGLNFAGIKTLFSLIPCWVIKPCSPDEYNNCNAYLSTALPCWAASDKSPKCKNSDCRVCDVYRFPEQTPDIKSFLKKFIK